VYEKALVKQQLDSLDPSSKDYEKNKQELEKQLSDIAGALNTFKPHDVARATEIRSQPIGISKLSIAWAGNIQVGDKIISVGLNEKELREVREILMDAYLNPGKYEAESYAVSLIKDVFNKDPKTLSPEEKELRKLAEKALKGDEKAMEELRARLDEHASRVSENLSRGIELLNKDPKSLSEEEREEQNQIILGAIITNQQKIEDSDAKVLDRLRNPKEAEEPPTQEEINTLCEKYRPMALEYYQNRQSRRAMYSGQIPEILKNLDKTTLFAYLSMPH